MNIYPLIKEIKEIESSEEIDRQTVIDTIESLGIEQALNGAQQWRKNIAASINGIDEEIKRLQARKTSMKNKDEAIKQAMFYVLARSDKKQIKTDLFTFSKRKGSESVVINSEFERDIIAAGFGEIKEVATIDKQALKKALKDGLELKGASIEIGEESLQVR